MCNDSFFPGRKRRFSHAQVVTYCVIITKVYDIGLCSWIKGVSCDKILYHRLRSLIHNCIVRELEQFHVGAVTRDCHDHIVRT